MKRRVCSRVNSDFGGSADWPDARREEDASPAWGCDRRAKPKVIFEPTPTPRAFLVPIYRIAILSGLLICNHLCSKAEGFRQEYHEAYPLSGKEAFNDVRALAIDGDDRIWVATADGVHWLDAGDTSWNHVESGPQGPVYDVVTGPDGAVWVGAWDGLYLMDDRQTVRRMESVKGIVSTLGTTDSGILALGPDRAWMGNAEGFKPIPKLWSGNVTSVVEDGSGSLWISTLTGLHQQAMGGIRSFYREDQLFSGEIRGLSLDPYGRLWIGALGGLDVYENGVWIQHIGTEQGLPNPEVQCLTFAPDGSLWTGTRLGVARLKEGAWSLRHSRRWLLSDDVRDIAFDSTGNAWMATSKGVSAIKSKTMTLKEKADHFYHILLERHVREPWIVEKCYFPDPSDRSKWEPWDDDNDGSFTGMYLVMEAFRFAVTGDPLAKERADRAFEFLEKLRTITEKPGFIARTMIPSDWTRMADPNETISAEEAAERRVEDPRYKPVENRWRPSSDGKWLWKGDTSSDEVTGHFYAYWWYDHLVADAAHKERIRTQVRSIMDGLIRDGYVLNDIDGTPTRWGVWSPEKLNHDPDWRVERPINAFEILSFLKVTYSITGDSKYQSEFLRLIRDHGYGEHARRPKSYERSDRTHIDDDLLCLAVPGLLMNETDPALKAMFMEGYTWAYRTIEDDVNPLANFTYGLLGGKRFHLNESLEFLRDHPLDLIQWHIDNSKREDLRIVRQPILSDFQIDRMPPPSERGVMRWDKNPWATVSGDFSHPEGRLESSGVFWLLPYWMGRYAGFIEVED